MTRRNEGFEWSEDMTVLRYMMSQFTITQFHYWQQYCYSGPEGFTWWRKLCFGEQILTG